MTHNREQGTKYKSFLLEGNGNPQLKYNYKIWIWEVALFIILGDSPRVAAGLET